MPELPEVETTIRDLVAAGLTGARICGTTIAWPRTVGGDAGSFTSCVVDQTIGDPWRRGKYIIFPLTAERPTDTAQRGTTAHDKAGGPSDKPGALGAQGAQGTHGAQGTPGAHGAHGTHGAQPPRSRAIVTHLRMSGRLFLQCADEPLHGYERAILHLEGNRELRFYDPRKFGRMIVTDTPERSFDHLGMEPLGENFGFKTLAPLLSRRTRQIKPLLLDQTVVAGLGNIYVDEALWRASIHPETRAADLTEEQIHALVEAIPYVLNQGIRNLGTQLGSGVTNFVFPGRPGAQNQEYLTVFRQTGKPCPRCETTIERLVVGQRGTHICPRCQVRPVS